MRRLAALGTWLAVTVAATALAWTAVSRLGARSPRALSSRAVAAAVAQASQPRASTTTTTTTAADSGASTPETVLEPSGGPATTSPGTPVRATTTTTSRPAATATTAATVGTTTPTTRSQTTATTGGVAPQPTTTTTAGPSMVITAVGGVTTVQCSGTSVRLLSSSPRNGFRQEVDKTGPGEVEVRYESDSHRSDVHATCSTGQPVSQVDESDEGPGSGDH